MTNNKIWKKGLIVGIIIIFIGLIVAPTINAINYKITKRINYKDTIETNIEILKKTQADEIDITFNKMKKKLDNTNSQKEYNIIFKETLTELSKYGLLGDKNVNDVYKIMINNGEASYSIYGESNNTYVLENIGIMFYELNMKWLWGLFLDSINLIFQYKSWITFGWAMGNWEGHIDRWVPSEGYIYITSSEGKEEYNGTFYGQMESLSWPDYLHLDSWKWYFVGITGFKGINIGNYYFGTAEELNISPKKPW